MPLVDQSGRFIYSLPMLEQLQVIADKPQLWQWANVIFVVGDLATVAGLSLLALHLEEDGERISSRLGLLGAMLAAPLFAAFCSLRVGSGLWAAQELVMSGSVPDAYMHWTAEQMGFSSRTLGCG
jgi:hypothetical protein